MYRLPNPVECEYDIDCAPAGVCDISTFKCVPASFAPAAPGPSYGRGPVTGRQVRKARRALKYARAMNPLPPKPPPCPEGYQWAWSAEKGNHCVPDTISTTGTGGHAPPPARLKRKRKKPTSRYTKLAKIFGSTQARRSTSRRALVGGAGPQAAGVCPPGQVVCGTSYPGDPPICCPAPSGGGGWGLNVGSLNVNLLPGGSVDW